MLIHSIHIRYEMYKIEEFRCFNVSNIDNAKWRRERVITNWLGEK